MPKRVKKILTTMQILQFVIGFTFAAGHLFVEYAVPVSTPHTITSTLSSIVSAASSAVSSAATDATSIAAGATPVADWLKKLAFRAVGEEGLAENVLPEINEIFVPEDSTPSHIIETIQRQVQYRTQWETIPCIDTQGQAFAIYLNLAYLLPLTFLFARFFIRSYTRRGDAKAKDATHRRRLSKAAEDAAAGVSRELDSLGQSAEDGVGELVEGLRRTASGSRRSPSPSSSAEGVATPKSADKRRVSAVIERLGKRFEEAGESAVDEGAKLVQKAKSNGSAAAKAVRKKASEGHEQLRNMWENGVRASPAESAAEAVKSAKEGVENLIEEVPTPGDEVVSRLEDEAERAVSRAKQAVSGKEQASSGAEESKSVVDDPSESATSAAKGGDPTEGKQKATDETKTNGTKPQSPAATPNLESGSSKDTDASWEDIRASQASIKREDSGLSTTSTASNTPSQKENEKPTDSPTPTLARTQSGDRNSPHRSRIPRPKDSSRSRSPVKRANGARAGSATPLSSRANGAGSTPIKEEEREEEKRTGGLDGTDEREESEAGQHDAAHPLGMGEGEESFADVVKDGVEQEKGES